MIRFEFFEPNKHYQEISKLWEIQKWQVVPLSHLPKTGIVVYSNEKIAWAAWIYKTDSAFCILDWIVASPEIRKNERTETFEFLINEAKRITKELGFSTIFTVTRHEPLIDRMKKLNFSEMSNSMTSLIYNVGGA